MLDKSITKLVDNENKVLFIDKSSLCGTQIQSSKLHITTPHSLSAAVHAKNSK
jgi:hypothetical protein